jgi:hypothetical protein
MLDSDTRIAEAWILSDPIEMKSLSIVASSKWRANSNWRIADHPPNEAYTAQPPFPTVILTCEARMKRKQDVR